MIRFEIKKNKKGEFYFRGVESRNAQKIFHSEGYINKSHCYKMIEKLVRESKDAEIRDLTRGEVNGRSL